jgi:hypothetical protein
MIVTPVIARSVDADRTDAIQVDNPGDHGQGRWAVMIGW